MNYEQKMLKKNVLYLYNIINRQICSERDKNYKNPPTQHEFLALKYVFTVFIETNRMLQYTFNINKVF